MQGKPKIIHMERPEIEWVLKNLDKLHTFAEKYPYRFSLRESTMIITIEKKLKAGLETEGSPVELSLQKSERLYMLNMASGSIKILEGKVIPGYTRRINGPRASAKYAPYVRKAAEAVKLLKGLEATLERSV